VNEGKDITPGQTGHLKGKAAEKQTSSKSQGRHADEDQSGGTKGSNAYNAYKRRAGQFIARPSVFSRTMNINQ
jgi:hypothetical protein